MLWDFSSSSQDDVSGLDGATPGNRSYAIGCAFHMNDNAPGDTDEILGVKRGFENKRNAHSPHPNFTTHR